MRVLGFFFIFWLSQMTFFYFVWIDIWKKKLVQCHHQEQQREERSKFLKISQTLNKTSSIWWQVEIYAFQVNEKRKKYRLLALASLACILILIFYLFSAQQTKNVGQSKNNWKKTSLMHLKRRVSSIDHRILLAFISTTTDFLYFFFFLSRIHHQTSPWIQCSRKTRFYQLAKNGHRNLPQNPLKGKTHRCRSCVAVSSNERRT